MAGSENFVFLIGRLGKDPKASTTGGGKDMSSFSVATDEGYTDRQTGQKVEKTEWHKVVVWGASAQFCNQYLSKGRLVSVMGKLQTRKFQDNNTGQERSITEVVAKTVQALDKAPDQPQQGGYQPDNYQPQQGGGYQQQGGPQGYQQQGGGYPQQGNQPQGGYPQQGGYQPMD